MIRFWKKYREWIIVIIVLALIAGGYFYYSQNPDLFKGGEEKSVEELKQDAETLLLKGDLRSVSGAVSAVGEDFISLKYNTVKGEKEEKIVLTKNTLIRKIEFLEVPDDAKGLMPAKETIIDLEDIGVGDEVVVDINKETNEAVIIDLMREAEDFKYTTAPYEPPVSEEKSENKIIQSFSGNVAKISNKELIIEIMVPDHPKYGEEVLFSITPDTAVKAIKPNGSVDIDVKDINIDSNVTVEVDDNNDVVLIFVITQ